MNELDVLKALIKGKSEKLHEQIGAIVDAFIINENLGEDAVTLNIVFNAFSNNLQAIVQNNHDIPAESVELMIQSLTNRLRKAYQSRKN